MYKKLANNISLNLDESIFSGQVKEKLFIS